MLQHIPLPFHSRRASVQTQRCLRRCMPRTRSVPLLGLRSEWRYRHTKVVSMTWAMSWRTSPRKRRPLVTLTQSCRSAAQTKILAFSVRLEMECIWVLLTIVREISHDGFLLRAKTRVKYSYAPLNSRLFKAVDLRVLPCSKENVEPGVKHPLVGPFPPPRNPPNDVPMCAGPRRG